MTTDETRQKYRMPRDTRLRPKESERLKQADMEDVAEMYVEPAAERTRRIGEAIPALAEGNDRWRIEADRKLIELGKKTELERKRVENKEMITLVVEYYDRLKGSGRFPRARLFIGSDTDK